jgi:hypothetical protein
LFLLRFLRGSGKVVFYFWKTTESVSRPRSMESGRERAREKERASETWRLWWFLKKRTSFGFFESRSSCCGGREKGSGRATEIATAS